MDFEGDVKIERCQSDMCNILNMSARFAILVSLSNSEVNMKIITYTEARNNFKTVLDRVTDDADYTVITRRDAADTVVMSLDYFDSLLETVHLLKSPANAAHLARSIEQFNRGAAVEKDLLDE